MHSGVAHASKVVGVMLTGMGRDGVEGMRSVFRRGSVTIAQDESTSVVYGMPGVAVSEGLIRDVLPIDQMASHLIDMTGEA